MSEKNCIFYRKQKGSEPFCDVTQALKKDGSGYCYLNPDCYYKQLQTITAERDKFKTALKEIEFYPKKYVWDYELAVNQMSEIAKQALEGNK